MSTNIGNDIEVVVSTIAEALEPLLSTQLVTHNLLITILPEILDIALSPTTLTQDQLTHAIVLGITSALQPYTGANKDELLVFVEHSVPSIVALLLRVRPRVTNLCQRLYNWVVQKEYCFSEHEHLLSPSTSS